MNGLRGMPFSASSWTSELNGVPDGSRPTRRQISSSWYPALPPGPPGLPCPWDITSASEKVLEMDWTENGTSQSPAP